MKPKMIFLLAGLACFWGCRLPHPALVPEISPPLEQAEVFSWKGNLAGDILFPCAGGIGWVDASGAIVTWNPADKSSHVIGLPFPVTTPPFRQGDFLVLKNQASDRLLVYDLAGLTVKFESRNMGTGQIVGVDDDCLVYLEGERLAIRLWGKPSGMFHAPLTETKYFNCYFYPRRILVLGQERLLIFWKETGKFEYLPLPQPAASPFFCDGEKVYYGSTRRCLVKFSLRGKRPDWELKLGKVLERRPFTFAGMVVASPADQTVLQVNRRGSILWWLALQSTMSFDLEPMSEHLAALLLNHEIKFIDPKRRQVTVFKGQGLPASRPLAFRNDLYFMAQDEKAYRLQRVGNQYGVLIHLEPARARWVERSVRFTLQPCNLLDPSLACEILDAAGRPVFSKSVKSAEPVSLAWVPLLAGKYTIRVQAKALNRDEESEAPLEILDPRQVVPAFYLHL
jgi:hypothetical protein